MKQVWQTYNETKTENLQPAIYPVTIIQRKKQTYFVIALLLCILFVVPATGYLLFGLGISFLAFIIVGIAAIFLSAWLVAKRFTEQVSIELASDKIVITKATETITVLFTDIATYTFDDEQLVRLLIKLNNKQKVALVASGFYCDTDSLRHFALDFDTAMQKEIAIGKVTTVRKDSFFNSKWALPVLIGLTIFCSAAIGFMFYYGRSTNGMTASIILTISLWVRYSISRSRNNS